MADGRDLETLRAQTERESAELTAVRRQLTEASADLAASEAKAAALDAQVRALLNRVEPLPRPCLGPI